MSDGTCSLWDRIRGLCRTYSTLIGLSIVTGVAELAYGIVNQSAIPPYVQELELTQYIGIIFATFLVVETLLKSPMGALGDRIGRRPLLVCGALVSALASLGIASFPSLWPILALRAMDGIAAAAIWPTMVAAVGGCVHENRRTTAMSALTVMYIAGVALGPLAGGYANDATDSRRTSFYLVSILFVLTAACSWLLVPKRLREEENNPPACAGAERVEGHVPERPFRVGDLLIGLKSLPDMMLMAFCAFFAVGLLMPIVKLFAMDELRMTETQYGQLVFPIAVAVAGVSIFSGLLSDRWGKPRSIKLGILISAVSMWVISFVSSALHLAIVGAFLGIGFALAMPAWLALISDLSTARTRGAVVGALGTAQGVGAIIGAVVGPYLYENVPLRLNGIGWSSHYAPFVASALGLTICLAIALISMRKSDRRRVDLGE